MEKVSPFIAAVVIAIIAMLTINAHAQTFSSDGDQHRGSPVLTHLPAAPAAAKINSDYRTALPLMCKPTTASLVLFIDCSLTVVAE
jgi:hypothetical protein